MSWETVIGLEVHAQLKTNSKLFSSSATAFGASPNTQTSFIDAGLPGVLPVLNREAVRMAIQFGLAIGAEVQDGSYFERKNYFYPDLPKGYQISQFKKPIVQNGFLTIPSGREQKTITILRAHLEEDAGKSLHEQFSDNTGIDLNRAGMPLLEIVTTPCMNSAQEAVLYLKTLHRLLRFLDICDGNMQEGSFRCDVNLSIRKKGHEQLGVRTELKNLNSFRYIEKAILYESARHQDCLEHGQAIIQETRLYSPATNSTYPMRSKEEEHDYRYFPDPDLLPIKIDSEWLNHLKSTLPELPEQIEHRLVHDYALLEQDLEFLLTTPSHIQYFDALMQKTKAPASLVVNWLKGNYTAALNEKGLSFADELISLDAFATLLERLSEKQISNNSAKIIFKALVDGHQNVDKIIAEKGLQQETNVQEIEPIIQSLIDRHPQQVADYQAGKEKLLGFFVGLVMKETKGKADPAEINAILRRLLTT